MHCPVTTCLGIPSAEGQGGGASTTAALGAGHALGWVAPPLSMHGCAMARQREGAAVWQIMKGALCGLPLCREAGSAEDRGVRGTETREWGLPGPCLAGPCLAGPCQWLA